MFKHTTHGTLYVSFTYLLRLAKMREIELHMYCNLKCRPEY
jgi:hypothetical protein